MRWYILESQEATAISKILRVIFPQVHIELQPITRESFLSTPGPQSAALLFEPRHTCRPCKGFERDKVCRNCTQGRTL